MIEKWVIFKRDYLEISFLRENCGYDGSDERRRTDSMDSKYAARQVQLLAQTQVQCTLSLILLYCTYGHNELSGAYCKHLHNTPLSI